MALGVVAFAETAPRWATAAGLVACVWIDALAGWLGKRAAWAKSRFATALEMAADFVCFIWAPASWIAGHGTTPPVRIALGVFVLAGAWRLARFQAEGLVRGGYRGLPVTYMGYLVPLAGGVVAAGWIQPQWAWPAALAVFSWAMVSTRFVIPEF